MLSGQLFDNYAASVYSYILLIVKNQHIAEDLTQETFVKVVSKEHQFKNHSSVKTWIFRIAYNTTISYLRKKQYNFLNANYRDILSSDPSPEEIVLLNTQQKNFYEALRKLKPRYQQIIILRKIEGFSIKETSTILSCSEGIVKMRLSRAMLKFKNELEKGGITSETLIRR